MACGAGSTGAPGMVGRERFECTLAVAHQAVITSLQLVWDYGGPATGSSTAGSSTAGSSSAAGPAQERANRASPSISTATKYQADFSLS